MEKKPDQDRLLAAIAVATEMTLQLARPREGNTDITYEDWEFVALVGANMILNTAHGNKYSFADMQEACDHLRRSHAADVARGQPDTDVSEFKAAVHRFAAKHSDELVRAGIVIR